MIKKAKEISLQQEQCRNNNIRISTKYDTADFTLKVLGVYTHSMETIYLSLSAQVAMGTFT